MPTIADITKKKVSSLKGTAKEKEEEKKKTTIRTQAERAVEQIKKKQNSVADRLLNNRTVDNTTSVKKPSVVDQILGKTQEIAGLQQDMKQGRENNMSNPTDLQPVEPAYMKILNKVQAIQGQQQAKATTESVREEKPDRINALLSGKEVKTDIGKNINSIEKPKEVKTPVNAAGKLDVGVAANAGTGVRIRIGTKGAEEKAENQPVLPGNVKGDIVYNRDQAAQAYLKQYQDRVSRYGNTLGVTGEDLGSWGSGRTEKVKGVFNIENSRDTLNEQQRLINAGYFNNGTDYSMMNDAGLANQLAYWEKEKSDKEKLAAELQEKAEADSDWQIDGEAAAERLLEKDGLSEDEIRYQIYDKGYILAQKMGVVGDQELWEDPREIEGIYDTVNGGGAYQRRTAGMSEEEKAQFNDEIAGVIMDITSPQTKYRADLDEAENEAIWAQQQIDDIRRWQGLRGEYSGLVGLTEGSDSAYHPEYDRWTTMNKTDYLVNYAREVYGVDNTTVHEVYSIINEGGALRDSLIKINGNVSSQYKYSLMMSDEMVDKFNEYYNAAMAEGREPVEAEAFLDALQPYLTARWSNYETIQNQEMGRQTPIIGTMVTLADTAVQPIELAQNAYDVAFNGGKLAGDPNSINYAATRQKQQVRGQVAEDLGDAAILYNAATSGMDSALNVLLAKGLGAAGKVLEGATLALFGTQAFQTSMQSNLSKNPDMHAAFVKTMIDTMVETATEIVSVENLLSDPTDFIQYILKTAFSEGSEEVVGAIANPYIQKLITGTNEWEELAREVWANREQYEGINDYDDAVRYALRQWNNDIFISGLTGALSTEGGIIVGGTQNLARRYEGGKNILKGETASGVKGAEYLMGIAGGMNNNTKSYQMAEEIGQDQKSGKKISPFRWGKLAESVVQETSGEVAEEAKSAITDIARDALTENGVEEKEADNLAGIIAKARTEGLDTLSRKERKALVANEAAYNLFQGMAIMPAEMVAPKVAEKQNQIRDVVQLAKGVAAESIAAPMVKDSYANADMATEKEYQSAKGRKTGAATEAVHDGNIVQINAIKYGTKKINGKNVDDSTITIQTENGTQEVSAQDVHAINGEMGGVIRFARMNKGIISEKYANTLLKTIAENGGTQKNGSFLDDAVKIVLAANNESGAMPKTNMDAKTAESLWSAAKSEFDEREQQRVAKRSELKENAGKMTFMGAEYGTSRWNEQTKRNMNKADQAEANVLGEVVKRLGFNVNLINDENADMDQFGWEDESGNITINLAANRAKGQYHSLLAVAAHEMTHWLEQNSAKGYAQLRNYAVNQLKAKGVDINQRLLDKIDLYSRHGAELDLNGAMAEIVADACDQVLGSRKMAEEMKSINPTLFGKMKEFVRNFTQTLQTVINKLKGSASYEARQLQDYVENIAEIWLGARQEAMGAEVAPAAETKQETIDVKKSFSLNPYTEAEKNNLEKNGKIIIFDGNRKSFDQFYNNSLNAGNQAIKMYFGKIDNKLAQKIKASTGLDIEGYNIALANHEIKKINISHGNAAQESLRGQTAIGANELFDAITVIKEADSINRDANDYIGNPVIVFKKNINGVETAITFVATGKKDLRIQTVFKGTNKNGSLATAGGASNPSLTSKTTYGTTSTNNVQQNGKNSNTKKSIRQENNALEQALENPKKQFSMNEPVEARDDGLIAVHNLTWEELKQTMQEGGFTAPSIAVILAKMGHTKYGEVSVVFKPSAIDPMTNSKNKVYGADAYTPTRYNATVETELDYDKMTKAGEEISELVKDIDQHMYNEVKRWFQERAYKETTTKTPREMAEDAYNNEALMAAYLKSKGKDVPIRTRERYVGNFTENEIEEIENALDAITEAGMANEFVQDIKEMSGRNLVEKYAEIVAGKVERFNTLLKLWNEKGSDLAGKSMNSLFRKVNSYLNGGNTKVTENDWYETKKAMWDMIDKNDMMDWLEEKLTPAFGEKGIRNDLDPFTYAGNRRTFKQLHYPYTIENILKAMYKNASQKGQGGGYANGSIATVSKEYRNLQEVREDRGRLRIEKQEQYDKLIEDFDERIDEIAQEVDPDNANYFHYALMEAGRYYAKSQTDEAIRRGLKEENVTATKDQIRQIRELLDDMREVPTGYFEAKPERIVGLDEIAKVVIPENTNKELLRMMDEGGIPYETYNGNDADRVEKVNNIPGVQFSVRDEEYMKAAEAGDMETAQRMADEAAKEAGYTEKVYHGTPTGGFNTFRDWSYFTKDKTYADRYQNASASSTRGRYEETKKQTYELYMNPGKVFDTRKAAARKIYNEMRMEYGLGDLSNTQSGLPDWTDGRDIIEFIEDRGLDYDTILLDEGADGGYGEEVKPRGISYVTRSNMVKSADAITYDDQGNIIPLSERFNPKKKDIRYSVRSTNEEDNIQYAVRSAESYDVEQWMKNVPESSLQTPAEKQLLRDFKGLRMKQELNMERQRKTQEEIRKIEGYAKTRELTAEEKRMLAALKVKLANAKTVGEQLAEQMYQITGSEGYATLMYQQQKIMDDYVHGRTQQELHDTVDQMNKEADEIRKELSEKMAELARLKENAAVQRVRSYLGASSLKQWAKVVRDNFGSRIETKELEAALAEIALKKRAGEKYQEDVQHLAARIMETIPGEQDPQLRRMRGTTIVLSDEQMKELIGQRYNMKEQLRGLDDRQAAAKEKRIRQSVLKELRGYLAGTGIKIEVGERSTLTDNLSDFTDEFGNGIVTSDNPLDVLDEFLKWVTKRKEAAKNGAEMYHVDEAEVRALIMAAAGEITYKEGDSKATRDELAAAIQEMSGEADRILESIDRIMKKIGAMQKSGHQAQAWTSALQRDVAAAVEYYNKTARLAQETAREQKLRDTIAMLKSEAAEKMAKANEEWRALIERDKQARNTAEDIGAARGRINTAIKRLYKLMSEPKGLKNVPEHMQGLARELIGIIVDNDLSEDGRKLSKADKEQLIAAKMKLDAWNARDGEFNLADLSGDDDIPLAIINDDLKTIYDAIEQWNKPIRGKNKADTLQQRKEIIDRMQEAISDVYGYIRQGQMINIRDRQIAVEDAAEAVREGTQGKKFREKTGRIGRTMAAMHKGIVSGNMTPEYFFRMLGNKGLSELWEGLFHEAENRNGLELKKAQDKLAEIAEKHGFKNWDMKQKVTLKMDNGDSVEMTVGQLMSLYATWKREQTIGPENSFHLTRGGFYAEQDLRDGWLGSTVVEKKAHRMTESDAATVENLLTDEQRAFVDDVVEFMSNDMSKIGNEASMKAYGIKMYKESYYFPFKIWDGVKNRKSNDAGGAAAAQDRAFHQSFTKARMNNASNALLIGDFMQTAADHIAGMINYATMGLANENLQKVLNQKVTEGIGEDATVRNTQAILDEAYGSEAMGYLNKLKEQLNGGAVKTEKSFYDKLISLFRKNAVAGSMSVALQQPLSYIRAAMLINSKYLARALSPDMWRGSYQEMMAHSGVAVIKDMGRFDMNFGQSAREYMMPDAKENVMKKVWKGVEEATTILPELMDRMTWTRMWSAVKLEQKALHPEMNTQSDEFLDMCGRRFNEVMRRTQVYDSVLVKSANMRSQNTAIKSLTSFMAEPTLTLNVLADSIRMAKNGEAGGKMMVVKAGATFLLSAIMQAAVKGIMGSGRTPDEKKTWLENFMYRFEYNFLNEADPMQLIPGFSDVMTLLKGGELKDDAYGTIKKMISAGQGMTDMLIGKKDILDYKNWEDSAAQLMQLFSGVPAKNLMRDARAMYNWVTGVNYADRESSAAVMSGQAKDLFFNADNMVGVVNKWMGEAGYQTDNKAYYERIYQARKAGDTETEKRMTEYLTNAKGVSTETIQSKLSGIAKDDDSLSVTEKAEFMAENGSTTADDYVREQLRNGSISADEARKALRKADPTISEDSAWWTVDRIEYQKEKGLEKAPSGQYYRLYDAMDANVSSEIKSVISMMTRHGMKAANIKSQINKKYREAYMAADSRGKVAIRDAMQKAYKALGYSAADADKVINGWK